LPYRALHLDRLVIIEIKSPIHLPVSQVIGLVVSHPHDAAGSQCQHNHHQDRCAHGAMGTRLDGHGSFWSVFHGWVVLPFGRSPLSFARACWQPPSVLSPKSIRGMMLARGLTNPKATAERTF